MNLSVKKLEVLLKECGNRRDPIEARKLHNVILRSDQFRRSKFLANVVIEMYGKCGYVEDCCAVFSEIERPNLYSWCILLTAYARNGYLEQAREVLYSMPQVNVVAWTSILKLYAHSGDLHAAEEMFCKIRPLCNLVCWNCMLGAYAQHECIDKTDSTFDQMPAYDVISWNSSLFACAQCCSIEKTKNKLEEMPEWDIVSWNVMLLAYTKAGLRRDAELLFNSMPEHDLVTYSQFVTLQIINKNLELAKSLLDRMPATFSTRLLQGYVESNDLEGATHCFNSMPELSLPAYNLMIVAYSQDRNLHEAQRIFYEIPERSVVSWTSLVAAFADNGHLSDARKTLEMMPVRNIVAWTAMISSYAHHGHGKSAISLFRYMELCGEEANEVSILGIILACNHKGMLQECIRFFRGINHDYNVYQILDHYLAMVVVLGRLGHINLAKYLLDSMPFVVENRRGWEIFLKFCESSS